MRFHLFHRFSNWELVDDKNILTKWKWSDNYSLDYRLIVQKRVCAKCSYVEYEQQKLYF